MIDNNEIPTSWAAIDAKLHQVYGDQEPMHWGTIIGWELGGSDPLRGISAYRCSDSEGMHFHYITYGLSEEFGFELTFRLHPFTDDGPEPPEWVWTILQDIARFVSNTKNRLDIHHWIGGKRTIRPDTNSEITALIFLNDPVLGVLSTPNGTVQCLQAVGLTANELDTIRKKHSKPEYIFNMLQKNSSLFITDLTRKSVIF